MENKPSEQFCFVSLLEKSPYFSILPMEFRAFNLIFKKEIFYEQKLGQTMGFHDWLRKGDEVLGFRFSPFPSEEYLIDNSYLRAFPYIKAENNYCVEVFFSEKRDYEEERSDHQSFWLNKVLVSKKGKMALALDYVDLKEPEIKSLFKHVRNTEQLKWVQSLEQ